MKRLLINLQAEVVEGDPCYPDLKAIPEAVDAVMYALGPAHDRRPAEVNLCQKSQRGRRVGIEV